jgi:hypothetical protein
MVCPHLLDMMPELFLDLVYSSVDLLVYYLLLSFLELPSLLSI